ncbi:MAG: hypothetical protein JSR74_11135 [Proteobacteria bacterium]|nr:hypothetical protein [Pseudomonadota bacterium]
MSEILQAVLGGDAIEPASTPSMRLDSFSLLSIYIELLESGLVRKDVVEREFTMSKVTSTDELLLLVKSAWVGVQTTQPPGGTDAASRASTRREYRSRRPPRANLSPETDEGREHN